MESQPLTAFLSINLIVFLIILLTYRRFEVLPITLDSAYRIGKHSKLGFQGVLESPPNQETRQKANKMGITSFISRELGRMNPGSKEGGWSEGSRSKRLY